MLLNRIKLENIRSYKDHPTIEIPLGSTLFEGDIGSGKSTILSAIEFALFGLGDVDGKYLLRSGCKKGSVLLEFTSDGKRFEVYRSLVRGKKTVTQDDGYIVEHNTRTDYSVNEMKPRILELIGINERPHAKTTSLIYRFAIFTPQEMMKQVLRNDREDRERRLDTLRRAFGIEEYSIAKKNSEVANSWTVQEIHVAEKMTEVLPETNSSLEKEQVSHQDLLTTIDSLRSHIGKIDIELEPLQRQRDELNEKKIQVIGLRETLPILDGTLKEKKQTLQQEKQKLGRLNDEMKGIDQAEDIIRKHKSGYDEYVLQKQELESLEEDVDRYDDLDSKKLKFEGGIERERNSLETNISILKESIDETRTSIGNQNKPLSVLPTLYLEVAELEDSVKELPGLRKTKQIISDELSKIRADTGNRQEKLREATEEIKQILKIGVGAQCPKCKQKLSEEHISKLETEFHGTESSLKETIGKLELKFGETSKQFEELEKEVSGKEDDQEKLSVVRRKVATLESKKETIEQEIVKLAKKEEDLKEKSDVLENEAFCLEERKQLNSILADLDSLSGTKGRYDGLRSAVREYEKSGNHTIYIRSVEQSKQRPRIEADIEKEKVEITKLDETIRKSTIELEAKRLQYDENKGVLEEIESLEERIEKMKDERGRLREDLTGKNASLEANNTRIQELKVEIRKLENLIRRKQVFYQTQLWLDKCFSPAVSDIENQVLSTINDEFNQVFQEWFNILIETGYISVEVDETFSPVITQNGYQLDVDSLSGGEKTSVALAYRLALNVLVKKTADLQSDLLILDEPTDGFSSEQLIKLRQVLDRLKAVQVIMVSHEHELESCVDNICKVTKEGGISKVELLTR